MINQHKFVGAKIFTSNIHHKMESNIPMTASLQMSKIAPNEYSGLDTKSSDGKRPVNKSIGRFQ